MSASAEMHVAYRVANAPIRNAFHGVEPLLEREVRRDLLLYDIKVKDDVRSSSPASGSTGSDVRSSS